MYWLLKNSGKKVSGGGKEGWGKVSLSICKNDSREAAEINLRFLFW